MAPDAGAAQGARPWLLHEVSRARVLEALSWEHSAPALLAAYERLFEKMGRGANRSP